MCVLYCRQKIDEAPTPYRYMSSESDQSECESGSDAESLGSLGHNDREKILKDLASAGWMSEKKNLWEKIY